MAESRDNNENGQSMVEEVDEERTRENENGASGDHDETDVFGSSFFRDTKRKPEAKMPVPKYATFYNMQHRNRGFAVILNHENFMVNMKLKARAGTSVDARNLEKSLKKLGFKVEVHEDLSVAKVDSVVEDVSKLDHSDSDCFVLACLSHGEQGILYANDAPYKPDTLWSRFTADKCPSLAGKPKLFFIQACQGDQLDGGVTMRTQVDGSPSYKIPSHADFLIAYSTIPDEDISDETAGEDEYIVQDEKTDSEHKANDGEAGNNEVRNEPGFYSWRNTLRGSWFMQALCEELDEHAFTLDILTLLTFVNRKVAVDYESNVPDNSIMHQQKQIPCITYMLTRVLRFTPKDEAYKVDRSE